MRDWPIGQSILGPRVLAKDQLKARKKRIRPRLLFVVTEDWYFVSHRLALAIAARQIGYDVSVATRVNHHGSAIEDAGIALLSINFDRGGLRPDRDLRTLANLIKLYRREAPDIVHHVALKPVIYGSLAARIARVPAIVNALGGLGYVYSSADRKAKFVRSAIHPLLRAALSGANSRVILQNAKDVEEVIRRGLVKADHARLIRGAGVNPEQYAPVDIVMQPPLVILPARLLRDKGVGEFVAAAQLLRDRGILARFALVGQPDPINPASFTVDEINAFVTKGVVENWGWCEDMVRVFAQAQIVCLPSYHEGLPKSLLEAAAAGCAIIASDIPGCKEIITEGKTGLLVPPRDSSGLADALQKLIENPKLRQRLGSAAKALVTSDFSLSRVISETLDVYSEISDARI
jgi:glycosyltransferase involved in cell wall biosynthesis